ncbi:MAG: hypothetical protein QOI11_2750, partial [Candidatus Eremiobacteraeota bacterium]|nr:hypothetical protein [Candidatus Eremiobacteraeota bacterium]
MTVNAVNVTVGQRKIAAAQRPQSAQYWRTALDGANATTIRPDRRDGAERTGTDPARAVAEVPLSRELSQRLRTVSGGDPRALHLLLTATVAALVRECTGSDDVLLGSPSPPESAFPGVVPARVRFEPADSLRSVLERLRQDAADSYPHLDFPSEVVGPRPVVLTALAEHHGAGALRDLGADTGFMLREGADGFRLGIETDPNRYAPETGLRLGRHCVRLLEAALASPGLPLADLDLVLDSDRAVVEASNDTARALPEAALTELFARTVAANCHKTAVLTADAAYTFAQLDAASTRIARSLVAAGAGSNGIVAVFATRSFEMLAAVVGVLKAGVAYLPIDPALPTARVQYLLEDSGASVVLAQAELAPLLPAGSTVLELTVDIAPLERDGELPRVAASDAAYVIYTSGSTGQPKGVVIEHRSAVNRLKWMQRAYPIGADDVILHKTPASFDVSVWELFWWLLEGAAVSLLEPGGEREPAQVVDAIERHRVTVMHFVPTMLNAFLEYVELTGTEQRLASLRCVFASGEALGAHHVRRFARTIRAAKLVNLYGPTEATVDVTHQVTDPADPLVPIGTPIDNIRVHVIDRNARPRPVGMIGELAIAGVGLARGYLNRPGLTAERFVPGDHLGEERIYLTGDLVRRLADGSVEYIGRNDFQVKIRGYRIELGEIEHCLRSYPAVRDAAVIARTAADGQAHLLAYVMLDRTVPEAELAAFAGKTLPGYMVPDRITVLDAFPLSSSGKLDRKALPEPSDVRPTYAAPRTEPERLLASIWAEVLGLERVGIDESFFALGGNSIHFVSVLGKARQHGLNLSFQQLFRYPTIDQLVAHAGEATAGEIEPQQFGRFELLNEADRAKVPAGIEDAYPMSMMQSGMIYQSAVMEATNSYHDVVSYVFQGSIDPAVFREALRIYVERQPVFRTSYNLTDYSDYVQLVHERVDELPLFVEDLRHLTTEAEHEAWYQAWFREEQARPWTWERPGFVRLHIHVLEDNRFRYCISQHNSALDGWSKMQVHTTLFDTYFRLLRGEMIEPVPTEDHLRNFIGMEKRSMESAEFARFWGDMLADRPTTAIPRLRPPDPSKGVEVVFQEVPLPDGLSDQIIALARRLEVPVKNVLLAAHLKFHAVVCGEDDLLTGYEHAGRPELLGADVALGVFTNSMPLRFEISGGSWAELIAQAHRTEAKLLPYRRYPMAKVKQDLRTTDVLFETVFNFVHFYTLKELKKHPELTMVDSHAGAITEFALRVEFAQHHYTDAVELILQYHTADFDEDHVARLGGYLVRALELMVVEPDAPHDARTLLSDDEIVLLAGYSAEHGEHARVVDRRGNLAPLGTPGRIVTERDGQSGPVRRGRWLPGGVLEERGDPPIAPATAALPKPAQRPASDPDASAVLKRIARIWSDVLKMPVEQIRSSDDFLEIGGNSLAALRVVLMLAGTISLRDFMRCSRLHELAALVAERESQAAAPAPEIGLLVQLTKNVENVRSHLICFPYAGGNAVHFGPFAAAMSRCAPEVAIWGVELPGHDPESDRRLKDFATTSEAIAGEIERIVRGPV